MEVVKDKEEGKEVKKEYRKEDFPHLNISIFVHPDKGLMFEIGSDGFSPLEIRGLGTIVQEQINRHAEEIAIKFSEKMSKNEGRDNPDGRN